MPKSDLVEISGEIKRETEKAYFFYDGDRTQWIPKQFVENNGDGTFTMPEWLAQEKGFI